MHTAGFFDYPVNAQPKQIMLSNSGSYFLFSGSGKRAGCCVRVVRAATSEEQLLPDGLISATYTDYDGNAYQCTKIGLQVWTTKPLKVTHYADGTLIPTNLSDAAWDTDTVGACAVYGKKDGIFVPTDELTTEALMVAAYGRLYNWYAVNNAHGLIDTTNGWHVPTDAEFTQLTDYLIATYPEITSDNVGDVLKSVRQVNSPYVITDQVHIKPKDNKRIDASIIDNLPIESIVAGTNVTIDVTDPKKPVINVPVVNGTNGRGIVSRVLTSSIGLVDTYTTTYTDGTTDTYTVTNGTPGTILTADQLQIINTVPLVCSDEKTDIVASLTESKIKFVFQTPQSFTNIIGELNVSAVGGTFTVDVTKNGVSILSTYLTFDSGETSTRTALIPKVLTTSPVSFDIGDYVEVFVRIVGALVPGKGLKIYLM